MYMNYYYATIPFSSDQADALGMTKAITGMVNAATPIGAALSCFQYNYHANYSYRHGYYMGQFCIVTGTFLMA